MPTSGTLGTESAGRLLSVAVLSLGAEEGLVTAVASVLSQDPEPEVVVVNSGGGEATARLADAGLHVRVIEITERLRPGGVRNLGLAASSAPYAAFLAADCLAKPGWVAGRLAAHLDGAPAVGSMLTNAYPESRSAATAALLLHHRRMAHTPAAMRLKLGLSYDRSLFERFGRFREDLRTGEDSELNSRLVRAGVPVMVSEAVLTAHRNPRTPAALLREQYMRGVRQARARRRLGMPTRSVGLPAEMLLDAAQAWRRTAWADDPAERRSLRRSWPLVAPAALAYATGSMAADRRNRRGAALAEAEACAS